MTTGRTIGGREIAVSFRIARVDPDFFVGNDSDRIEENGIWRLIRESMKIG